MRSDRWIQRARTSFGACYRPNSHCGPEGGVYRSIPSLPQADQTLRPSGLQHPLIDQTRWSASPQQLANRTVYAWWSTGYLQCAALVAGLTTVSLCTQCSLLTMESVVTTTPVTLVLKKYSGRWRGPHSPSIMCFSDCQSYLDAHR